MTSVGKIILGTAQLGSHYGIVNTLNIHNNIEQAYKLLLHAYENGVKIFDTAFAYGHSHETLIKFFANHSQLKPVIHTKISNNQLCLAEDIVDLYHSLADTPIEIVYFHNVAFATSRNIDILLNLQAQGIVRNIGLSIYSSDDAWPYIDDPAIQIFQFPYNLLDKRINEHGFFTQCRVRNKTLIARSIFLQGVLLSPLDKVPRCLAPLRSDLEQLHQIANKHNLSLAQLALNWALNQDEISYLVIGVDSQLQLAEHLKNITLKLPTSIIEEIQEITCTHPLIDPRNWS
jgi:aryl-alcohol dehydrogenase-like predicted oxidoreductase